MIRLLALVISIVGLVVTLVVGRLRKTNRYFFWRRIIVLWGCLLVTVVVAIAPLKVRNMTNVVSNRDILFVLDTTLSMNAIDGRQGNEATRLDDARTDMQAIVKANAGASMGLYTFSDQADLTLPLTTGADDISAAINTVHTAAQFASVNKVISYKDLFDGLGKYLQAQRQTDPTRQRVVVMLSDFEIFKNREQTGDIVNAASALGNAGAGFVGLVYGQTSGAKMLNMAYDYVNSEFVPSYKRFNSDEEYTKYLQDNYKTAISVANPQLATDIAKRLGGTAIEANKTQDFSGAILKAAKRSGSIAAKNKQSQALNQNIFYTIPALLTFGWLVFAELVRPRWLGKYSPKRKASKKRKKATI